MKLIPFLPDFWMRTKYDFADTDIQAMYVVGNSFRLHSVLAALPAE